MFAPANHAQFRLSLPGVEHDFQVLAFTGFEAISQPYAFELELVSERPDLDLHSVLHQPAFLTLSSAGNGIHGLIYRIAQGDSGDRLTRYQLGLRPHLAYLAHSHSQRIFQQLTVEGIIRQVFDAHGLQADAYRFQLGATYPEREYCVQYGESDLHFIQRLCEEEGIHYHFQHSPDAHVLVFGDDQTPFAKLAPTVYRPGSGQVADEPAIKRFGVRVATRANQVTRRDYDFEKPRLLLTGEAAIEAGPELEDYGFPGRFVERARGKHLSQRALERHRHDVELAKGESDQPLLASGYFLSLAAHARADWNDLWLLTEVIHEGKQPQVLEESISHTSGLHAPQPSPRAGYDCMDAGGRATQDAKAEGWGEGGKPFTQGYRNRFTATPWAAPYRPALLHPKPRLLGSQSAIVTGPAGEDIHCDAYGRIKVQFHWDREGQADDKSSCWLRVASRWAGDRYGALSIPRVGMEVLVSFLEGDPDQPLVTGCLYHKENPVPYELPAHKTRTVFKTLTSPGGNGFNELRIDDRKDAEQIYIHAQRDWEQHIQHDQRVHVGHERHDTIEANSYTELKGEEHRITHRNRLTELKADDHLTVHGSQHVKLASGQFVEAGQEIHLSSGQKIVMEAGSELTLKVGGSFVKLDASGVTLVGGQVKINSGGGAGSGSGAAPIRPGQADAADASKAGELLVQAQKQALMQKKPLCAICEAAKQEPADVAE